MVPVAGPRIQVWRLDTPAGLLGGEDKTGGAEFCRGAVERGGIAGAVAGWGAGPIERVPSTESALIVLALGPPDMAGPRVLKKFGTRKTSPPVLILSARDAVD